MNPQREGRNGKGKANSPSVRPNLRVVASISWADIPSQLTAELVRLCTKHGAAVMFGRTSDGGALSLCILDNQNKVKEYPRDQTDVNNIFTWLRDVYFGPEPGPTPAE